MSYENPDLPEGINVSKESVGGEFLRLLAGLGVVLLAAAVLLYLSGGWLARWIPFETERDWVGEEVIGLPIEGENAPVEAYLQRLTESLGRHMDLPEGLAPRVHYTQIDEPNAFATLGGHIVVTHGLYARMPSENALSFVLAHEVAHLRARDPIGVAGGAMGLALFYAALGGSDSVDFAPYVAHLVQLGFSRSAEREADRAALAAVRAHYGHAGGAAATFEVLAQYHGGSAAVPTLLSTHPADDERIAMLRAAASDSGARAEDLRPLEIVLPSL